MFMAMVGSFMITRATNINHLVIQSSLHASHHCKLAYFCNQVVQLCFSTPHHPCSLSNPHLYLDSCFPPFVPACVPIPQHSSVHLPHFPSSYPAGYFRKIRAKYHQVSTATKTRYASTIHRVQTVWAWFVTRFVVARWYSGREAGFVVKN